MCVDDGHRVAGTHLVFGKRFEMIRRQTVQHEQNCAADLVPRGRAGRGRPAGGLPDGFVHVPAGGYFLKLSVGVDPEIGGGEARHLVPHPAEDDGFDLDLVDADADRVPSFPGRPTALRAGQGRGK